MTETLNREYFWNDVETQNFASLQDDPRHAISFDADTIANALVNIYQKKYGNGRELEPTLFEKTKEILGGAVNKGWNAGGSPATDKNSAFIDALRHNTDVFSAFRTHKMQSDIAAQLLDSKGKLKPFGQFVKDVKPYVTHQNRAWLQTEYDTAVLRAHQAADWQRFEDEKDVLPNLEWKPSTSPNPGEDHKPYWGTILPVDHEFWNQHRPGDRWNCKCSLRNTDKQRTAIPVEHFYKNTGPQKGLDTNPVTTGEIFSTSHPYFPENCGVCPFNKGVGKLIDLATGRKRNCNKCKLMNRVCSKELKKTTENKIGNKFLDRAKKKIKLLKPKMDEHNGVLITTPMFYTGSLRILRRSLDDVLEHLIEDNDLKDWISRLDFSKLKGWKYEGWAYCRVNPKTGKSKHPETHYFLYYSLTIQGHTYWANVKRHKKYNGEVLYTIEKEKPDDLHKGKPPKIE